VNQELQIVVGLLGILNFVVSLNIRASLAEARREDFREIQEWCEKRFVLKLEHHGKE